MFWNEVFNRFVTCKFNHGHSQFIFTPLRGRVRPHQGYKASYVIFLLFLVVVVVVVVVVVLVLVVFLLVVVVDVDVDVDDVVVVIYFMSKTSKNTVFSTILVPVNEKTLVLTTFLQHQWRKSS